jgi:HEPN domain-containing protein
MSLERVEDFYGCEEMSPEECFELACEYQRAAQHLKQLWRPRKPGSRAPFRFTATHAIELYLTAYLLRAGETWAVVRNLGHDLQERYELAAQQRLVLKKRTVASLEAISKEREYLRSRYAAKETKLQLNKVEATLTRVAEKVTAAFNKK